jgi:hypothetical protein
LRWTAAWSNGRVAQVLPFSLLLADPIAMKCLMLSSGTWTAYQVRFLTSTGSML